MKKARQSNRVFCKSSLFAHFCAFLQKNKKCKKVKNEILNGEQLGFFQKLHFSKKSKMKKARGFHWDFCKSCIFAHFIFFKNAKTQSLLTEPGRK